MANSVRWGITAIEDRIVQRGVVAVLSAIYEEDFLGFSYGFRPERSQHDALDALAVGIGATPVNWILDADIRSSFVRIDQQWLIRFLGHRIGDERVIRLVRKWLKAGVLDDGVWSVSETGTPQGAVASPLLANVFLHYVFDLWAAQWRRREAKGSVIIVRYADDIVVGFAYEDDARRFWDAMRKRFEQFALELHGDKTRLLEFGRFVVERRQRRGLAKPETFASWGSTSFVASPGAEPSSFSAKQGATACGQDFRKSRRSCVSACTTPLPDQGRWLKGGGHGLLRIPRGAYELAGTRGVPVSRYRPMATYAAAA